MAAEIPPPRLAPARRIRGWSRRHPDWASVAVLIAGVALSLACAGRPGGEAERGGAGGDDAAEAGAERSRLDAALARSWDQAGLEPTTPVDDAAFLRRASLDLRGRVPTRDEVARFVADEDPDKRAAIVDAMLASDEFAAYWSGLWAARLLPSERRARRLAEAPLEAYLAEVLGENRPWGQVVDELVASEGSLADKPQLAYVGARNVRGAGKQGALAELSSTTARVFLGARIECAQCHDHPYLAGFSSEDFWAQTAYFGRLTVELEREGKGLANAELAVGERARGELRIALGGDEDPRKRPVAPRFMGEAEAGRDGPDAVSDSRRAELAARIVADPRFAEATVGWVWTQLFGRGIVEPWDDLLELEPRPEPLEVLAEDFRASGHDLRALVRDIVLSQAYQRSSASEAEAEASGPTAIAAVEAGFARAAVRPLSAEQLFASLLTVTELEQVEDRAFRRIVQDRKDKALREYEFVFADDEMARAEDFAGNVPQALLLLNGGLTNQSVVRRPGSSLDRILGASAETDARLGELWLTVYGRRPDAAELELGRAAIRAGGGGDAAWEDLMFAMLSSTEFSTNH